MPKLTHFDEEGRAVMVDVSAKAETERVATGKGVVRMQRETLALITSGGMKKGDVLSVAQLAGIMGAKRTPDLVPLCHPLALSSVKVDLAVDEAASAIEITATCKLVGRTGVEMEALTAVSVAALTVYDMCKAVHRGMPITDIRLEEFNGLHLVQLARSVQPQARLVVFSGFADPVLEAEAEMAGATWLLKPIHLEQLGEQLAGLSPAPGDGSKAREPL